MKIGTLVECIDSRFSAEQLEKIPNCPQKGNHYMIREIIKLGHLVGVLLEEIHNPITAKLNGIPVEPNFNIERFREIEGLDDLYDELVEEVFAEDLEFMEI
jgi:hypothetical protein